MLEPLEEPSPTFKPLEEPSPTVEPLEEEREELPDLEGSQKSAKPLAPEGPQNSEDGEYLWDKPLWPILNKLQEMKEEDEQNRATGGGARPGAGQGPGVSEAPQGGDPRQD